MDSGAAPLASGGSRSVALALMPVMAAVLVVFVITGAALPAMSRYRRLNTRGFVALLSASDSAMACRRWLRMPRAERCEREETKRLQTAEKIEMKRCKPPGDLKPRIDRSRFRNGT
jgi:hypothetical protein